MSPVSDLLTRLVNAIVNPLIRFMFVIALMYFLYGVVQFIRNSDSDDGRTVGKRHMLYGVIGMSIMISVYAIMSIAFGTLESLAR
jgi:hypothetical protein